MEKKRLQFDFTLDALEELEDLQRITGLQTRVEVIRHALRLLQWAAEEVNLNDATLLIEKQGKLREVVLPFLGRGKGSTSSKRGKIPVIVSDN
ncbi:MAG: hypothetical protein U0R19_22250 [Bryobacteraceae bacterium]